MLMVVDSLVRYKQQSGKFKGTVEATSFIGDVANMGVGMDKELSKQRWYNHA